MNTQETEEEPLTVEQQLRIELGWRTLERDEALAKLKRVINDLNKLTSLIIKLDKQVSDMSQCPKCVDDSTEDCAT